jgi:hypothetical protein
MQLRLHRHGLLRGDLHQVVDAIGRGLGPDGFELPSLLGRCRHDELAATPMRHAALCGVGIQQVLAFHAQPRLERALRVVDARVNHFAVARTGPGADGTFGFEHQHFPASQRQCARHGQPHHTTADDGAIDFIHRASLSRLARRKPHDTEGGGSGSVGSSGGVLGPSSGSTGRFGVTGVGRSGCVAMAALLCLQL